MTNKFVLYSRQHCHLCQDMLVALVKLRDEFSFEVAVADIDADPALKAKYNAFVPVLEAGGLELCRYHMDTGKVREFLRANP